MIAASDAPALPIVDRYAVEYICEINHPAIDFQREQVRHVDLRLERDVALDGTSVWTVTAPRPLSGKAQTLPTGTRGLGGVEGVRWRVPDGGVFQGTIAFSDMAEHLGPQTIWLTMGEVGTRPRLLTCGPLVRPQISEGAQP